MAIQRVKHDYYVGPNGNRFQPAPTVDAEYVAKKVKRGEWKADSGQAKPKADQAPDGDPTAEWTVAQLTSWAGDNGVDVPAGPKPAVVEAVMAALAERNASNQD